MIYENRLYKIIIKGSIMTKLQTWTAAQSIINGLNLEDEAQKRAFNLFEELLAPKKSGNKREVLIIDDINYYFCRFTGLYFPSSEMIYQNDKARAELKDKGYSKIGISIWNQGQKYLKALKFESVEIAYGDDQSDEMREKGLKLHQEANELIKNNSMNNYEYLMKKFLSNDQADYLEGLNLPEAH